MIKAPYWDGTAEGHLDVLKAKKVNLVPVFTETFLNTVFVNLSDKPTSFSDYIKPILSAMSEYDLLKARPGLDADGKVFTFSRSVDANWKTVFENACINVLHENFVHGIYSASPEVPRIKEDGVPSFNSLIDDNFMALEYNRLDFQNTYPPVEAPHLGFDTEREPERETFGTLYPNFYVSASTLFVEVALLLPCGPEKSISNVSYFYQEDVARAEEALADRQAVAMGFLGAFEEDRVMTEAVQKARRSPVYQQKFYAPFWDTMHHYFSKLVLNDLKE